MKKLAIILAAFLGIVIVVLLGLLIFWNPAKAPTISGLQVSLPHSNDVVSSPVAVEGIVTGGGWFFEASFPIEVIDANGTVVGRGTAKALSDWMSTGTVPFAASITFTNPNSATGALVLYKDNPSGAPENAGSSTVPIRFK